jgi:[CysO sulfur-carrier protein]-S-L-cysteine hydrolase
MSFATPTLRLTREQYEQIVAHCYEGFPEEACGLFGGPVSDGGEPTGDVTAVFPCRKYTVDSRDLIKAMRAAEADGGELVGVCHSHTHTEAYPSATDVRQAMEPGWIYALVSLKDETPVMRAYRIRDGEIAEVAIAVSGL